jgi:hypothetical protein
MRRFIFITLTLCMLGFTASAWAGPGNHGQEVRRFNQQSRQGQQSFQHRKQPFHQQGNRQFNQHGNRSFHRQGNPHFRQSGPMAGPRFRQPSHNRNHKHRMDSPRHRHHRFQGHGPREVRNTESTTSYRTTTTSSVLGSYQSLGGSQQLSVEVLTTE